MFLLKTLFTPLFFSKPSFVNLNCIVSCACVAFLCADFEVLVYAPIYVPNQINRNTHSSMVNYKNINETSNKANIQD
jgi:hypothetical protein